MILACRMRKQLPFGDRADSAVPVPENPQDPGVPGPRLKPEVGLQRCNRDDAFDGGVSADEPQRNALPICHNLRLEFRFFHGWFQASSRRRVSRLSIAPMMPAMVAGIRPQAA